MCVFFWVEGDFEGPQTPHLDFECGGEVGSRRNSKLGSTGSFCLLIRFRLFHLKIRF